MFCRLLPIFLAVIGCSVAFGEQDERPKSLWSTDYSDGYRRARDGQKQLLIWFSNDHLVDAELEFAQRTAENEATQELLENYVTVRVSRSAEVEIDGKSVWLFGHRSFSELLNQPGLAVIDLRDRSSAQFGQLVSLYPYRGGRPMDLNRLHIFLTLPDGTLTQRTMVFAVRTHREGPQSTHGSFHPYLAYEAHKHSAHQASLTRQGHHNWDRRFQWISSHLPNGLHAQEVCAEGWPWQGLIEAAEDCVHCWRQSPGHWSAVRAHQPLYGYDIQRGRNGVWYATGIFGRR